MAKVNVILICGGKSTEHEVSVMSARSIYESLDKEKYNVVPVGITKAGRWVKGEQVLLALQEQRALADSPATTTLLPDPTAKSLLSFSTKAQQVTVTAAEEINVVFPVLHGRMGEDGTIQGLLELANVAYVGCGVMSSSLGLDKVKQKELFTYHGIPTPKFYSFERYDWKKDQAQTVSKVRSFFGNKYPLFVKPANTGSSVGVVKVKETGQLESAIVEALRYDNKILVEEGMEGIREIEISVLGNHDPQVSGCGEVIPCNEFYDYNAKYIDGKSGLEIPAKLDPKTRDEVRSLAAKVFKVLDCRGLSRVDFFVSKGSPEKVWVNEINTLPGFTSISMYPKLWEQEGVSYSQLVERLIELAIADWKEKQEVATSFEK